MYHYAILFAALSVAPAQNPSTKFVLKTKDTNTITGTVTYEITAEKVQATQWVAVAAIAPELPGQTNVKTVISPTGVTATDASPFSRKIFVVDLKTGTTILKTKFPIKVTYTATLRSRTLMPLVADEKPPVVPALSEKERKLWLSEFGDCDYSLAVFDKWMKAEKLVRGKDESDLDYARRAFVTISAKFKYDYKPDLKRRSSFVCREAKSDCAGLSALFVSLMRVNQIPARTLYGRWAKSADPEKKLKGEAYSEYHVKAEFYATGIGWVPVDLSGAILIDKSDSGLEFFGNDKGDFLTMHIDTTLMVDSKISGKQELMSLQRPAFWVRGKGSLDGSKVVEDWKVQ